MGCYEGSSHQRASLHGLAAVLGVALLVLLALAWGASAVAPQRTGTKSGGRPQPVTATRTAEGPLQIFVSIDRQTLRVFDKHGLLDSTTVSTGTGGFPTPTGIFAILDKNKEHFSNIYGRAAMPYMQRLTNSGVAMHSGLVTGRPASHGCIRLPHAFAIRLFGLTRLGGRVIIADEEVAPTAIVHPRLFKPKRAQLADATGSGVLPVVADVAQGPADIAATVAADFQHAFARAKVGPVSAEREVELQSLPVSVFVSRATGRVYVRHGFLPLLDAPVEIRDAERAIGTHVYSAVEAEDEGRHMRWTAVSVPEDGQVFSAADALDRIELPAAVAERISHMLSPGASLIVSDHGPSREMRSWGTDFIVLTE